jgi:hypothetical protein
MIDEELPRGFQDADIEMATLQERANLESRLRKKGICTHGWIQGPPGPVGKPTTVATCNHCNKVWPTVEAAHEERAEILAQYE